MTASRPTQHIVHPYMARRLADHVAENVLERPTYVQTYPGVFAHPDGKKSLIVVVGAAPISDVGARVLRRCKYFDTYLVLLTAEGEPKFSSPRSRHTEESWAAEILDFFSMTRDINRLVTTFEVMVADSPLAVANISTASGMIAAHIPFDPDPVNNEPFQLDMTRELDDVLEEEVA